MTFASALSICGNTELSVLVGAFSYKVSLVSSDNQKVNVGIKRHFSRKSPGSNCIWWEGSQRGAQSARLWQPAERLIGRQTQLHDSTVNHTRYYYRTEIASDTRQVVPSNILHINNYFTIISLSSHPL